ncbi:serine/arginine repetitive matrix protein 1-like [Paramacrobiotus metropolitanus]|uniref:serine/arginine repetitive matrix protein 1-like n=1 Tax=Paramacrobiotus metropolitanus TaxID=2943436 RepID=UPI0024457FD7|nr:serine/arginine repetitive matrix protein 1-like [Paramacrobiotus metropolitanus]
MSSISSRFPGQRERATSTMSNASGVTQLSNITVAVQNAIFRCRNVPAFHPPPPEPAEIPVREKETVKTAAVEKGHTSSVHARSDAPAAVFKAPALPPAKKPPPPAKTKAPSPPAKKKAQSPVKKRTQASSPPAKQPPTKRNPIRGCRAKAATSVYKEASRSRSPSPSPRHKRKATKSPASDKQRSRPTQSVVSTNAKPAASTVAAKPSARVVAVEKAVLPPPAPLREVESRVSETRPFSTPYMMTPLAASTPMPPPLPPSQPTVRKIVNDGLLQLIGKVRTMANLEKERCGHGVSAHGHMKEHYEQTAQCMTELEEFIRTESQFSRMASPASTPPAAAAPRTVTAARQPALVAAPSLPRSADILMKKLQNVMDAVVNVDEKRIADALKMLGDIRKSVMAADNLRNEKMQEMTLLMRQLAGIVGGSL